jgi:hypothetical protein
LSTDIEKWTIGTLTMVQAGMVVSLSLTKGLVLVTLVFVDQYYIIRRFWSQLVVIPAYITEPQLRENLGGQWNRCSIVGPPARKCINKGSQTRARQGQRSLQVLNEEARRRAERILSRRKHVRHLLPAARRRIGCSNRDVEGSQ